MLAGDPPFLASTPRAVLARQSLDPVPRIHTVRQTVPSSVEQAITKALAKVPADRFATAAQFAEALTVPVAVAQVGHENSIVVLDFANISGDPALAWLSTGIAETVRDRKSTRLNSSHLVISYAVFCLKKKKKKMIT